MKRAISVALIITAICGLFLAMCAGMAGAALAGYSITVYGGTDSTIDGKWTTNGEWDDAATAYITQSGLFRVKYYSTYPTEVHDEFLVEFFTDNTNDPEDYIRICYDCAAGGGTAPQTDDIRIDYVGHGTVITYKGTGTGWVAATLTDITVAESLSVSKLNGTNPHWTAEFRIAKIANGPDINNAIRVAMYDASNPSAGVQSWPPANLSSQDVPNDYGSDPADTSNPIPEGIGLGVVLIASSVAVLVGFYHLRRRPKPELGA